jgi:N-acetylneuraminic acid mutarotase
VKNYKFLLLPLLFLSFACEPEEEEPMAPNEKLEITAVEIPEEGGVKLKAKYTGDALIENSENGFLISTTEEPSQSGSIDLQGTIAGNEIYFATTGNLIYNSQYYVRAYIKHSETKILYSDIKSFVSLGSKLPEVSNIEKGLLQDTVKISGKYFTENSHYISVHFDGHRSSVIKSNDSIIKCLVPANIQRYDPVVKVDVYGKTATYNDFALFTPTITSLSEKTAALGDTLTIHGNYFDFENSRNKVMVGEKETMILSSSFGAITFLLPTSLAGSTNTVKLLSQLQETTFSGTVKIKKPVIHSIPGNVRAYETIEIIGEGFSPEKEENKVFFGENLAKVFEASGTKLTVRVPIGPYENRSPKLRIELMDYSVAFEGEVKLKDVWLFKNRLTANINTRGSQYFVHNNLGYTFEREDENSRFKVHVLDPKTESWSNFYVTYPRTEIQQEDMAIAYNKQSGRIFFYFSAEEKNFYEFSLQTKSFSLKKDYPGVARGASAMFSIHNNIYLGFGRFMYATGYEDVAPLSHFWSYNPDMDKWEQMADFPLHGSRSDVSAFIIGDKAYVGNGASHTGNNDFWRYSPTSNTWDRMADFPGARTYTSFFELDGKAYVYFGSVLTGNPDETAFRYNVAANDWMILDPVNNLYYTYFIYPDASIAIRFDDAVYLGILSWPNYEFFKADLSKLKL